MRQETSSLVDSFLNYYGIMIIENASNTANIQLDFVFNMLVAQYLMLNLMFNIDLI
jgi:hypothetical protein